ncbi:class II aldolase/adducin family protein [Clostridium peptidivorans]|uniref:class II aldolase/adducin family protein n=1 Tax=Clostridium peptidivorans TaxID=100174 RepID=UPI000BE35A43|nr:class II aldolase/adducin family protein [Clostridium peptidivorans]
MESYLKEKNEVIQAGKAMLNEGYTVGTWGNISVRSDDGKYMIITPSGVDYEIITPEIMSVVDMEGNLVSGKKPSIETGLHLAIYQNRPEINAIMHSHSIYTCAIAATREEVPPVLDEMAQIVGGGIKVAEYGLPGSQELAENCVKALGDRMAVLLANHGGVCVGRNIKEVYKITKVVEVSLQSYCLAKSIGSPVTLSKDQVDFMRNFFLNAYGKENK